MVSTIMHSGASCMLRYHLHWFNINTNLQVRSAQPRDPDMWEYHVGCRVTRVASVSMSFDISVVFRHLTRDSGSALWGYDQVMALGVQI